MLRSVPAMAAVPVVCLALATPALGAAKSAPAARPAPKTITVAQPTDRMAAAWMASPESGRTLPLAVGKSNVLSTDSQVVRVSVTDPTIADVVVMSKNEVLINGQKDGSTNLIVWTRTSRKIYDVVVRTDADALQELLRTALHSDAISAQMVGKALVLRGRVATPDQSAAATQIAQGMADKVINLIKVDHTPQIEVETQIVEIDKTAADQLGLQYGDLAPTNTTIGTDPSSYTFQQGLMNMGEALTNQPSFMRSRIGVNLQALFKDGKARLLARPSMVTTSGGKANILVGGQIPIPIQQALGTTTLEWKDYGVKLNVEPTIVRGSLIDLKVGSEVSNLDWSNAVPVGNAKVPAISTRQAGTQVMLHTGESLVIGGLLQNNQSENIDKLPFLGDIPILGQLFRSNAFQNNETELRIIVTPRQIIASDRPIQYKEAPHALPLLTPQSR